MRSSIKPLWKDAPLWALYLAMDRNGLWHWHEKEPRMEGTEWVSDGLIAGTINVPKAWEKTTETRFTPDIMRVVREISEGKTKISRRFSSCSTHFPSAYEACLIARGLNGEPKLLKQCGESCISIYKEMLEKQEEK